MKYADDTFLANPEFIMVPELASLMLLALGFLVLAMLQRKKAILSFSWTNTMTQKTAPKWRLSTAKLLRRDVRNNTALFKYLRQRKYKSQ